MEIYLFLLAPVWSLGDEAPQKLKKNVKLAYNFQRFPVQNLGFYEYRSRAGTVYFANTQLKKNLNIQWGEFECPLWVRWWVS